MFKVDEEIIIINKDEFFDETGIAPFVDKFILKKKKLIWVNGAP